MSEKKTSAKRTQISGLVRLGDDTTSVAAHLEPGDIAVIDHPDLDRATALELIEAQPAAVLNAAPCVTGRYPTKGALTLLNAGIPLLDTLGTAILSLREGQRVEVREDGVYLADQLIAQGNRVTQESNEAACAAAQLGMADQLESFAGNTSQFLKSEEALLLNGQGLDKLKTRFTGRPVVVVGPGQQAAEELKTLKHFISDTNAALIAVGSGAKTIRQARLKPELITGNIRAVEEQSLKSGAEIVIHSPRLVQASDPRLDAMGLAYHNISSSLSDIDLAIVIAHHLDAELIVPLGQYRDVEEFFDLGRLKMSSAFFTQLVAHGQLVSPKAIARANSRPIPVSYLWTLLAGGLAALLVALWITPFGQAVWVLMPEWGHWLSFGILGFIGLITLSSLLLSFRRPRK
ncbi:hypothetical protein BSR29_03975 [Boudabousia liubingyangii]|uniref:SteA-like C-terminal domain-containing protein n=1 Tax=Boudabousia liubingyangii TaxID=1921764 RepID=A0A1Q5PN69_9ACTO|nr:putative cytokinetic ring protein SteA [Boudabousia liubingyangii]OKL47577.1 hypothetical protein BSR28_03545 [Boudabousia liubingyangii]OKL49001.1 hypothetical protein BSR29_03975 [Boudabousia liubingyangii]